jgi:hypothetical protein
MGQVSEASPRVAVINPSVKTTSATEHLDRMGNLHANSMDLWDSYRASRQSIAILLRPASRSFNAPPGRLIEPTTAIGDGALPAARVASPDSKPDSKPD